MNQVALHPAPRWRDVVLEQVRVVALAMRPVALVVAAVLAVGTVVIVGEVLTGGPAFDSDETFPTALICSLFPFAVWRGERRFGPAFLWTLPVDRQKLALAKVLAGGVWTLTAVGAFAAWLVAMAFVAGASPLLLLGRIPLVETIGAYLLGSALVLGLRHPLRLLLGVAGLLLLLGFGSDMVVRPNDGEWRYVPGARAYFSAVGRARARWETLSGPTQWSITTVGSLGGGLAALLAATLRHRERRRH